MDRVDLRDKLFHGILTYSPNDKKLQVEKLGNILSTGKLYCRNNLKGTLYLPYSYDDFWNEPTEVSLSVFPYIGKHSFSKTETPNDKTSAYSMFSRGLALMFDESLLSDYEVRKGFLNDEYYLTGDIDIYKYLVGIKNSGMNIYPNLNVLYYFFKYYNHEIALEDFLTYTGLIASNERYRTAYDLNNLENIAEVINEDHWVKYEYNHGENKCEYEIYPPEYFLLISEYFQEIERIAKEHNVKLYDSNGVLMESKDSTIEDIKQMISYVLEQLDNTEEDRTNYLMKKYNLNRSRQ